MEDVSTRNYSLPARTQAKHVVFSTIITYDEASTTQSASYEVKPSQPRLDIQRSKLGETSPQKPLNGRSSNTADHQPAKAANYALYVPPTLVSTPWERERTRPRVKRWSWGSSAHNSNGRRQATARYLDKLPENVCRGIVTHVVESHQAATEADAESLLKDLHSVLLINRHWHRATRQHVYQSIWLPGSCSRIRRRSISMARKDRMLMLLQTLQRDQSLAACVHHIRLSAEHRNRCTTGNAFADMLATMLRICPNIQSVSGLYVPYHSLPDNILTALSGLHHLKELFWIVVEPGNALARVSKSDPAPRRKTSLDFVRMHKDWREVETLVLHGAQDTTTLGAGALHSILTCLPSLKHLSLSNLPASVFHNGTLHALGPLTSLRLECLPGITDNGLSQPLPKLSLTLRTLSLIDLSLSSLRTLSTLLTANPSLRRLTLRQDSDLGLPLGAEVNISRNLPLLRSDSLQFLHWDVLIPGSATTLALTHSLATHGFPALRTLRAPCDDGGALQALCAPLRRMRPTSSEVARYAAEEQKAYSRDLVHARVAAQLRTRHSRQRPGVCVVVEDDGDGEDGGSDGGSGGSGGGVVRHERLVGQYLGCLGSPVKYDLSAEFEGVGEAVPTMGTLLRMEGGEDEVLGGAARQRGKVGTKKLDGPVLDLGRLF